MPCSLVRLSVDLAFARYHVRFGSFADISCFFLNDVRFTPNSRHGLVHRTCLLCANSGQSRNELREKKDRLVGR